MNLKGVGSAGFFDADGDVGEQFFIQAVAQVARGDELPFPARERRRIDGERHRDGGLVDLNMRERHGRDGAGDGLADGDAFDAGDGQDVAGAADGFVDALESGEGIELGDFGFVERAVEFRDGHFVAEAQRSVEDAADGEASEVVAVIEIRD